MTAQTLGVTKFSPFIVYRRIKTNLKDIWEREQLSIKDIINVGIQLMSSLESLHSTGYIHTDIKLDNIMVEENWQIFLIDLGCAERYQENGLHREKKKTMNGELRVQNHFVSKNVFRNKTLSRRDDAIQIIYNLMILYNSMEPLMIHLKSNSVKLLGEYKKHATPFKFCLDNKCMFLLEVMEEVYNIKYDSEPDYNKLRFLLSK